jgi:hypothetical protein
MGEAAALGPGWRGVSGSQPGNAVPLYREQHLHFSFSLTLLAHSSGETEREPAPGLLRRIKRSCRRVRGRQSEG